MPGSMNEQPMSPLPPEAVEPLQRFRASLEVQAIVAAAKWWDGQSVHGDLMTLATRYHAHLGVMRIRGDLPSVGEIGNRRAELYAQHDRSILILDKDSIMAVTRAIWQPFRDVVWPKRPTKSVPQNQRAAEEENHWWWVAIDRQKWGIQIDPEWPCTVPGVVKITSDHSKAVSRFRLMEDRHHR